MKNKLLIFAITFILSLIMLSCAYASDVNGTVEDYSFIESNVVYDEIVDVSLSSAGNEITLKESNSVPDIVIGNKSDTISFEIVNDVEYSKEESDFKIENYETPKNIGFLNDGQICDMNIKSDEKLDATYNNISSDYFIKLHVSLGDVVCFEVFRIKMEDFDSMSFNEGKFKNTFAVNHELMAYIFHENNFENCLDCNIIICNNKATDDFAYSINNSVIGDERSIIYCGFNSSYFINQIYLFLNYNSYFSCFYNFSCFVKI